MMKRSIRIAVASGKGGTGKTTVATNFALVLSKKNEQVAYLDCDVEEPNGHIFLKPAMAESREISVLVPEVDESMCDLCGRCSKACRFSAVLVLPKEVLTFPKLCHSCGGCVLACPQNAIREIPRVIGKLDKGISGRVKFLQGTLNIGEAMAPPVIRAVLDAAPEEGIVIIDSPPGTSCPVIESMKGADVVLLVTEPTPFGLNDLKLAVETVRELKLNCGVVVNRAGSGNNEVYDYCAAEDIPVLAEIPDDREIAKAYSRGDMIVDAFPDMERIFEEIFEKLVETAATEKKRFKKTDFDYEIMDEKGYSGSTNPVEEKIFELVVISGKGGTGKTSIAASLFTLAGKASIADCDVDAADLHLVLAPKVLEEMTFSGGSKAVIDNGTCIGCGLCAAYCRFDAVKMREDGAQGFYSVDPIACEGCGVCVDTCPQKAILLLRVINGRWFLSETLHGPMVHARLGIAQENSGKLVSLVRREGKVFSSSRGRYLLICDGSPGTGCPVIASIAGADMALIVTEPSLSALHDLERVNELCRQFNLPTGVCINKADINPEIGAEIEERAAKLNLPVWGRIHYDEDVTKAQVNGKTIVEYGESRAAEDIKAMWKNLLSFTEKQCGEGVSGIHGLAETVYRPIPN